MEVLVFILIIVFSLVSAGKKQKKGQPPAKRTPVKGRRPSDWLKQQLEELEEGIIENTGEIAQAARADAKAKAQARVQAVPQPVQPVKVAGQTSPVFMKAPSILEEDEEGCLGGSMAHDHHEGESRAEHREHMAAIQRQEQEDSLAAQAAQDIRDMNIHRLRRAVVVSEILGRPKALQHR